MAIPKRSSLGTRLRINFLTYLGNILEFATTEEHNKQEIWVVGRSGCGLSINMIHVYVGEVTNAAKNSSYFPACSAVVMLKIEARSACTRTRGCSSASAMNESKKKTSELRLGLNFAVNVDFWVCNEDFEQ